ncbi:virulence protein RhuM/Fic/DOC family protein [Campylobacter hyointestinalis]|uniref:Protein TonB n=1 Tax=Campylobacter hyointestinalis subsp. hyointestinalis TaxID=91352 RepID=A0A855N2Q5_CAMHY|nr:virulence protein RhuM/Fic/DOC family protein [Campylobacter hyointestinalis]MDL2347413.1 virulence protein RhuM/Fic/DOC family protein [Campylobacter hyointestinalis]MDL2349126.1 virulence protein RhuM/Fic/DOC family protein [Campylobacter hyointestinalis]MDL2350903.1 virulence protein RhuM/Fic/DOC family protein [Campylobacter hyointestinalis]MDM1026703.1 virulence protein RhuM/Fic/DOC family protein [Campylobacter hyointestinalis]MDM1028326.1 virulence protein RhuM/Fic/DOC family protein
MSDIVVYNDGEIELKVSVESDTIWLNAEDIAKIFYVQRPAIVKHINNIYKDEELSQNLTCSKMEQVAKDGKLRKVNLYNLEMIISVGYRVNSKKATKFRQWATSVLKSYIVSGYAINQKKLAQKGLKELDQTINLLKQTIDSSELNLIEAKGLLDVIIGYSKTWSLLQGYDENSLLINPKANQNGFVLEIDEALEAIKSLKSSLVKKGEASELFGRQKANEFGGILGNIYQTFGGVDLIPSIEEKAAHLLYYIIKDHPFSDGNKRIGAFMFILFLSKNSLLYKPNKELKINDNALTALALMTAKSEPNQKDIIIKLIVNLLGD